MTTPDTPAHTPLPWEVEEGHVQRDSNGIRYWQITDGQDAIACNQFCYAGYDPAVNAANAAFIVRACNSHYQLVEAVEKLLNMPGDIDTECNPPEMQQRALKERLEAWSFARAAISQAGGASE